MTHRNPALDGAAPARFSSFARRAPAWSWLLLMLALLGGSPDALAQASMSVTTSYSGNNDPDFNFVVSAGDNIAYQVNVQNTGTVVLTNVVVGNPLTTPASATCATLNPGAFCSLLGGYLVTTADQTAGSISSTGSATSTEVPGPVTGNTVVTPVITPVPAMTVDTTEYLGSIDADSNGLLTVGDTVSYLVQMINTGTMPLTAVTVSDGLAPANCPPVIYTNQGCGLTGTRVITLADEAAGSIDIDGTATSAEVPGPLVSTLNKLVTVRVTSMTFDKTLIGMTTDADSSGTITEGDTLTYTLQMINTGTQNLTNVVVSDPLLTPGSLTCPLVNNFSGCGMNGTHVVTAAEAAAGSITNVGSATSNEIPGPLTSTVVTPVVGATASMEVVLFDNGSDDPDNNGAATVGDTISYQVQAQNTGTVALTNVVVSNPLLTPNTFTCPSVGVGGVCNLIGTYTITVADEAAGSVDHVGTATSTEVPGPVSGLLSTPVTTRTTLLAVSQAITGNTDPDANGQISAGDVLTYAITALNTGTQPLNAVAIGNPLLSPGSANCTVIYTFQACVLTGTYTVTAADAAAGSIDSTATVTTAELPGPFTDTLSSTVFALTPAMDVGVVFIGFDDLDGDGNITPGDVLTLTVAATNTGTATLSNVTVSEPSLAPASNGCGTVAPAGACVLTGTYVVTPADAVAGSVTHTGSAVSTEITTAVTGTLVTPVFPGAAATPTTLVAVAGNAQVLAVGVASEPMVVELTAAGVPLAGQTIDWTTTGGNLAGTTSVTDAAGRASTTVTLTSAGAIVVTATFAGTPAFAAASTDFGHASTIASLPGLTPNELAVAIALDNSCAALGAATVLTPAQQDLLAQCLALTDAAAISAPDVIHALGQLLPDIADVQARSAQAAIAAQFENLKSRMSALRNGRSGASADALTLTGAGGSIPLAGLFAAETSADAANAADAGFERWGVYVAGNIGRGESDATSLAPSFDFDIDGLTFGADYRLSDALILGGAIGYTSQDTDLAADRGAVDMDGFSLTAYASWYRQDSWYLDTSLGYGDNDFDLERHIVYSLPLPGGVAAVDQHATVATGGSDLTLAATFGRDFHRNAWAFGVYGRALYSRLDFDGFTEQMQGAEAGSGLGLRVDAREVTALSSVLGGKVDYAHSAEWGVLMPHFELEWQHEYRSDPEAIRAFLVNDPTATPITVVGDAMDSSYLRVGLGVSLVFTRGRAGFLNYTTVVGRDGESQDNLALGFRMEF